MGSVSDSSWVLQYTLTPSAFNADGAVFGFISDTINPNLENTTDSIGTAINSNGGNTWFTGSYADGSKLNYNNQINHNLGIPNLTNGVDYFVTIKRTSSTTIEFEIREGSHANSTVLASWSGSVASTVTGLQYLVFGNANWGNGSATFSGTIDDISFHDGVTTAVSGDLNSGNISASTGTFAHTFDTAGTYNYQCPLHSGMTGQIVVADESTLPSGTKDFTVSAWTKATEV